VSDELESTLSGTNAIERELGGGGQSKVFLARELALDRAVVIKVLPPETAGTVSAERFSREIRLAAPASACAHRAAAVGRNERGTLRCLHSEI
jgi:serine/threonine-protein kinase